MTIWNGIDSSDNPVAVGREGVAKIALRILHIVANSSGAERAFSSFGIIHTKLRNRLSSDTTHKTYQVKADIRLEQEAAGLVSGRLERKFGTSVTHPSPSSSSPPPPPLTVQEDDTVLDVPGSNLGQELINAANDSDRPEDVSNDSSATRAAVSASSTISSASNTPQTSSHAAPSARFSLADMDPNTALPRPSARRTDIPLRELFVYPKPGDSASPLEFYWSGGIRNLENELALYDLTQAK